ncbi:hypothetical protein B0H11DRAFT_2278839 [Mycena galericulata]|nr:hypothetical protein B0H11DRAFT_2278839 [Mycena galericulata]
MFMEIVNTICDIAPIYEPLVILHGSPITRPPLFLDADPIVTTLISTPTQIFMAWRIKLVTKSRWPAGLVAFLAFTSFAGGIAATVLIAARPQVSAVDPALVVWFTSTALADLLVTAFLVNFLWAHKTGFQPQTDSVTDKIIFFTVQTGALTSFAAIADVSLFLIVPSTTLNFIWDFSLSKMYAICLVSTLNARAEWNALLEAAPYNGSTRSRGDNVMVRVRHATDVEGLRLYFPSPSQG